MERLPEEILSPRSYLKGKRYKIDDSQGFEELNEQFSEGDKLAIVGQRNNNRFFVAVTVD